MADRRRVLVTGGSRGIGAAAVRALAARGLDVVFTYQRGEAEAAHLIAELKDQPGRVEARQHDLVSGDAEELVDFAIGRMGGLDSVVLNAGWWSGGRLTELDPDAWWNIVETNLRSTHRLSRAVIPELTSSPAGSLLLLSSAVALIGFPGDTAYGSAKAALIGFARSLAKEVGRAGVRVNVLAPGFVATDMTAGIPDASRDRILARTVLRRFASPEEMAASIVFLSEDATFTTGTVLSADGGWTL